MILDKFRIIGLQKKKDVELRFIDNKLILVAENGTGKTTVLSMLFYFLSKQWNKLAKYDFERIVATINGIDYQFQKDTQNNGDWKKDIINDLLKTHPLYETFILEVLSKIEVKELQSNPYLISSLEEKSDVPRGLILKMIDSLIQNQTSFSHMTFDFACMYLPTYRRIEKGFVELFADMDERTEGYIIARYPHINKQINSDISTDEDQNGGFPENKSDDLKNVFSNIWKEKDIDGWKRHTDSDYNELIEFGMDDVSFRVSNILSTKSEEAERKLAQLIEICNTYFTNKRLVLENTILQVLLDDGNIIKMEYLSSGEKQIVSVFCHLLLSKKKMFVIIDEPEISLSLNWQEKFITDILKYNNEGILAATHSPFIITNEIKPYTAGMNEFTYEINR